MNLSNKPTNVTLTRRSYYAGHMGMGTPTIALIDVELIERGTSHYFKVLAVHKLFYGDPPPIGTLLLENEFSSTGVVSCFYDTLAEAKDRHITDLIRESNELRNEVALLGKKIHDIETIREET